MIRLLVPELCITVVHNPAITAALLKKQGNVANFLIICVIFENRGKKAGLPP